MVRVELPPLAMLEGLALAEQLSGLDVVPVLQVRVLPLTLKLVQVLPLPLITTVAVVVWA